MTAAGRVVRAAADENPDLFWALRGGSGNYRRGDALRVPPAPGRARALSGLVAYPQSDARVGARAVSRVRRQGAGRAHRLGCAAQGAAAAVLARERTRDRHARAGVSLRGRSCSRAALVEPLGSFGTPLGAHVGVQPYAAWQQTFDPLLTLGARNYWKSHNFTQLDDGLFDAAIDAAANVPSPQCEIFLVSLGGAAERPAIESTAYPHRDARFVMNVHGRWDDPADDARGMRWARDFYDAAAPFATGGAYVNFLTGDETSPVRAAYGPNFDRLARIKRAYDPDNLFRTNHNIAPAA